MNLKKSYTYYIVYIGLKPEATITEIPTDEVKDKENVEETKEEDTTSKIQ